MLLEKTRKYQHTVCLPKVVPEDTNITTCVVFLLYFNFCLNGYFFLGHYPSLKPAFALRKLFNSPNRYVQFARKENVACIHVFSVLHVFSRQIKGLNCILLIVNILFLWLCRVFTILTC